MLRASLTSISKVNKTDVETLRTSVGSFANIAKAPAERLQTLPGFGNVKVRRIKDAFEKPFRHSATSSITEVPAQVVPSQMKGKERAPSNITTVGPSAPRPRQASPEWDIELDLNDDLTWPSGDEAPVSLTHPAPTARNVGPTPAAPRPGMSTRSPISREASAHGKRPSSPVWDIELDLNSDDEMDVEPERKRPRINVVNDLHES
jgi:DNA excision repair protein ERCC-1